MTDAPEMTSEQIAAYADDQLAQINDPAGYALAKAKEAINAEYEQMSALADNETIAKLAAVRDAKFAQLEPSSSPLALIGLSDLGLEQKTGGTKLWSASQYVEPERDGQPWCTWEDAAHLLAEAARRVMVGQAGIKAGGYKVTKDEAKSVLTLELMS